jgi:hypothetical protein
MRQLGACFSGSAKRLATRAIIVFPCRQLKKLVDVQSSSARLVKPPRATEPRLGSISGHDCSDY